tara:strand:- start:412 stop:765 length:354 start_codon:yes stop_codon:yes gene_type:complete
VVSRESHGNDLEDELQVNEEVEQRICGCDEFVDGCSVIFVHVVLHTHQHRAQENKAHYEMIEPILVNDMCEGKPVPRPVVQAAAPARLFGELVIFAVYVKHRVKLIIRNHIFCVLEF